MSSSSSCCCCCCSSSAHIKRYDVFPNFHGPDVRNKFLSHLLKEFERERITAFKDHEMERCRTIGRALDLAIRESRISIVLLSKNYASSKWCLNELVEILKCREGKVQNVMPIFYHVDPSDVRKQSGGFGSGFIKTCQGETEEVKQRWSKALTYVATIAGEHIQEWDDEAEVIQKITDVLKKLIDTDTPSMDFDDVVANETVSSYKKGFKRVCKIRQRIKEKVTLLSLQL